MLRIVFVMGLTCIANTWKKLYAFLRMRLIPLFLMQDRMQRHTDKPVRNIEREIQVHSSTKMLLAWAKPHQQSSVLPKEQKYPLEKWAVLWKTQFCCYSPFLYTQGTHLVRLSVQVSLTSFVLLTNVPVPARAAASLALEIHRQSPQLIPDCLTLGLSVSYSNYLGQCGHC